MYPQPQFDQLDYDLLLKRMEESSPNLHPLVCPKDFVHIEGYENPAFFKFSAFSSTHACMRKAPQEDRTMWSILLTTCVLIRYQVPTYFVSQELCEALLKTDAPEDMEFSELKMPMPAMLLMLPLEFSMKYFGHRVPYVTTCWMDAQPEFKCPIVIDGMTLPTISPKWDNPCMNFTMASWEGEQGNHLMQYDARTSVNRQIKDLVHCGVQDFKEYSIPPQGMVGHIKVTTMDTDHDIKMVNRLTTLCVNLLLAMTAQKDLITREHTIRPAKKDGKKIIRRALWRPNMIGAKFRVQYDNPDTLGSHRSPHAHWRCGHWRNQRHGPANQFIKLIWIQPVFVGLKAS